MATVSFYDLLSNHPQTWWSANTYKVRFVLNYKRIPYMTIGVHFPDIAETSQKLGLEPVARGPKFTVPIVEYEGTVVRGGMDIVKFLESNFPEPRILGEECEEWQTYINSNVAREVLNLSSSVLPDSLDDRDRKFYFNTRKVAPREECHEKIVAEMAPLLKGIKEGGYIYGKEIHYADFILAGVLMWVQRAKQEDFDIILEMAGIQTWWNTMSKY